MNTPPGRASGFNRPGYFFISSRPARRTWADESRELRRSATSTTPRRGPPPESQSLYPSAWQIGTRPRPRVRAPAPPSPGQRVWLTVRQLAGHHSDEDKPTEGHHETKRATTSVSQRRADAQAQAKHGNCGDGNPKQNKLLIKHGRTLHFISACHVGVQRMPQKYRESPPNLANPRNFHRNRDQFSPKPLRKDANMWESDS